MDRTEFSNKNIIFRVNTELLLTNMFLEKINSDRRTNFLCYSVYYSSVKMSTSWQFFNRVDQEKPRIKQVECCGVSIQMTQFAALPIPKLRVSSFGAFIRRGPVLVVQRRAVGNHKISRSPKSCRLSLKKKTNFVHQTKYQENHAAGQTPNPWVIKLTSTKFQAGYGGILCMMICCSLNKNLMGSIPVLALQFDQWIYKITTAPNLQGTLQRVCAYGFHYERPLAATVAPW